ncbi:MAG: HoxN/HupN/NixA family nickel/cobalt transporter [Nocardioidaceae bacterium]|nr:HoxN/HupN/NixA family nickel/cobalt transporter [Nocardioidaceae bacterium]
MLEPTSPAPAGKPRISREEKIALARCVAFVVFLHLVGWGLLAGVVAPQHYEVGGKILGIGLGVTAYTLGMRHAFDADHIAAIDNTTRKLMSDGQRPMSVGFWFSLGHSSVVFVMVMGIALGVRALADGVDDESSTLHQVAGIWGPTVSGVFLVTIAILNLMALRGILRVFHGMRRGHFDEAELERQLDSRGFLNRILGKVNKTVRKPWHMYPVGFLFGLGFDTVTEIGLLVIAGGAVAANLPWWAVITLPVLFAAGMSLMDTIDGAFMNVAYGWAFSRPVRKIYYNITVTALSVAVAAIIGVATLGSMLAENLDITSGPLAWLANLDLEYVGYGIVALFVVAWALSVAVWKVGRIEERWSADLR